MRVIAGSLQGRSFKSPKDNLTHPMSEKSRGGLFNALGDIEGLTFLDVYSGSGALSFESISRGAKSVISVEKSRKAHSVILSNIKDLGLEKYIDVKKITLEKWLEDYPDSMFDVIMADPPFDNVNLDTINRLAKHLNDNSLMVLCLPTTRDFVDFEGLKVLKKNSYGDSQLVFYRLVP